MKILHIDSSARHEQSSSRLLTHFFITQLEKTGHPLLIDRLDLAQTPPRHVTELQTAAMYTPPQLRTPAMINALNESDALCDRVLNADMIMCGIPMYNFGMPSTFKAFIDNIVRIGKTFDTAENGYAGFLKGKKILIITTHGANYNPGGVMEGQDWLTPHLRSIFGFMGIENPTFISAQPLQFEGEDAKEQALKEAKECLLQTACSWGFQANSPIPA